jgi:hypothetical protein
MFVVVSTIGAAQGSTPLDGTDTPPAAGVAQTPETTVVASETPSAEENPPVAAINPLDWVNRPRPVIVLAIAAFVAGLLMAAGLLYFYWKTYKMSIATFADLVGKGRNVSLRAVTSTVHVAEPPTIRSKGPNTDPALPPDNFKVTGPLRVEVNKPFTYVAEGVGIGTLPPIEWKVTPVTEGIDVILEEKAEGREVRLVALSAGTFSLTASGGVYLPIKMDIQVEEPETAESGEPFAIPYFGEGYGTQVLAILLLASIVVLAVTGRISDGTLATLLGALAGYIFGTTVGARRG